MRITIAEDSTLLREGLVRLLLEEDHQVLAAVGDADALLAAVALDQPDIVITDVRMPPNHVDEGLQAAMTIRKRWADIGVLVLSQYVETRHTATLINDSQGGVGYLLKQRITEVQDFLDALTRVASGHTVLDPEVVRRLLARTTHTNRLEQLTPREREVLDLMAQGLTNAAIAERLYVSVSSTEKHVRAVFDKLALTDTTGLSRRVAAVVAYLSM